MSGDGNSIVSALDPMTFSCLRLTATRLMTATDDVRGDGDKAGDGEGDAVTGCQRGVGDAAVAAPEFGEAASAAGAGAEDVAGLDPGAAGGVGGHLGEGKVHRGEGVTPDDGAVDCSGHGEVEGLAAAVSPAGGRQFVGSDQGGAEGGGGVFALGRAEA